MTLNCYEVTEVSHRTVTGPTAVLTAWEVGPVTVRCDVSVV